MSVYNLTAESSEEVAEFIQFPSPEELRNLLAPRLQSADDRLAHLAGVIAERQASLEEASVERALLETQAQRVRNAIAELENVQPAG
jgi:hypothetical protein